MKNKIKNIAACIVFCLIAFALAGRINDILLNKANNRYYILEECIAEKNETYEVQVFGSCHAYTSFDPIFLQEKYGKSGYVFANPGEIIPVTYLRMMERFKIDAPKVAVLDIWGLNAYETYSSQERIFAYYMPVNVELLPLSLEKIGVIRDFASLDVLTENFAIAKYKDRIMNTELSFVDFEYSFGANLQQSEGYVQNEMTLRRNNNGFAAYSSEKYTKNLADYHERQAKVSDEDELPYEELIVKYVDKIIELCDEYDVELIFYRAPYISTANELRKANWFANYCEANEILYFDLEKDLDFDHAKDFMDYYHLNNVGAEKATDYLAAYILEAMEK